MSDEERLLQMVRELEQEKILLADRMGFVAFVALEALANLAALGLEIDFKCAHNCKDSDFRLWRIVDAVFTWLAVSDVLVALVSYGPVRYFRGDTREGGLVHWPRCLDFAFVTCRVIDWCFQMVGVETGLKIVSAFRVMHLMNLAGKAKRFATFRELYWIMNGMLNTMKSVAIVMALLLLLMFLFAILITINTSSHVIPKEHFNFVNSPFDKDVYWGTVPSSMLSLFVVVTRDRWSDSLARPIIERMPVMASFFIVFIVCSNLAALSTIVGVVVESTLTAAKHNAERKAAEAERHEQVVLESLEQIFKEADADKSGDLTREELQNSLGKSNVRNRMRFLGITYGDLDLLFTLLDEDSTGKIGTASFFRSCARLRGHAMARDINSMNIDLKRNSKWVDEIDRKLCDTNVSLAGLLEIVDGIDREVIIDPNDAGDPVLVARRSRETKSRAESMCRSQSMARINARRESLKAERFPSKISRASSNRVSLVRKSLQMDSASDSLRKAISTRKQSWAPPPPLPSHLAMRPPGRQSEVMETTGMTRPTSGGEPRWRR
uniref:EF-hand domain-containing protein n=1 Tax=Zooxanthella nutricula TaxID=1333877 RepID=A0A7S2NP76_9DINO